MLYNETKVDFLILPNGRRPAEEFLETLDSKTLAKVYKFIERLGADGRLVFPHARKLEGYNGLWEMRVQSQRGAIRIFYVYWGNNTVILISGFIKKSQKTPRKELERVISYLTQAGVNI